MLGLGLEDPARDILLGGVPLMTAVRTGFDSARPRLAAVVSTATDGSFCEPEFVDELRVANVGVDADIEATATTTATDNL